MEQGVVDAVGEIKGRKGIGLPQDPQVFFEMFPVSVLPSPVAARALPEITAANKSAERRWRRNGGMPASIYYCSAVFPTAA
jgi:hypothetical protein